jgi:hypothetical protein
MDRRITIHLLKSVGRRRGNAEADRVWEVTQKLFADPVPYVLDCKWGLVRKEDFDDFLEVFTWSKEFGFDSMEGRQIKQGVIGVFTGKSFNPRENVHFQDGKQISLAAYAARMRIQFVKAADFNKQLQQKEFQNRPQFRKYARFPETKKRSERFWKNYGKNLTRAKNY